MNAASCCISSGSALLAKINTFVHVQSLGGQVHFYLEISTYDPLNYIMDNPILIVLICMGKPSEYKGISLKWMYLC